MLRRAGAQGTVLGAAFATILLASTALSTTSLYVQAVTESGLRRALTGAPLVERAMEVRIDLDTDETVDDRDPQVRAALTEAFAPVGADIYAGAVSPSYALPVAAGREVEDLTVFAFYEGLGDQSRLVDGHWPGAADGGRVPVAVSQGAARQRGWEPGDRFVVRNRLSDEQVAVSITGVYAVTRPDAAYWLGDPIGVSGVEAGSLFITYGPLVVPRSTFVEPLGADATARWRVDPHLDQASVSELPALRDGIAALGDADRPGSLGELTAVDSDIEALLAGVETPLLVARSAVAMPAALVLALAAYALLLTTRLLGEHRASEVSLLRARGLSRSQLSGQALREALMLALPAALVAPLLATLLLRAYDSVGPLAEAGLRVGVQPRASTWLVAATVAVGAVVVFVAPAGRSGATFVAGRGALGRQTRSTGLQRAGGDVLLAVAAGLAYWQLTTYGSPVLTDATGRLAVDPLLVLAPGLVLLAGAVLAMRLVPLASGAAERLAARGRGAPAALGAWQVSRRPGRHTGPALLLVMAIATAAFSVTYATAWSGSQRDRADFETGADLRLGDVTDPAAAQAVRELPGLTAAMRVRREPVVLGALDATVLALDAAAAAAAITVRGDLGEQPLAQLTGPLATPGTALPGLDIPPGTAALALPVRAGTGASPDPPVRIYAVLRDGVGVLHRVDLGDVVTNFEQRRLRVGLGAYVEPLRLVSVQVRHAGEFSPGRGLQPAALELRLGAPALDPGSAGTGGAGDPTWQIDVRGRDVELPEVTSVTPQPGGGVRAVLDPGCCQSVLFSASVDGSSAPHDRLRVGGRCPHW